MYIQVLSEKYFNSFRNKTKNLVKGLHHINNKRINIDNRKAIEMGKSLLAIQEINI